MNKIILKVSRHGSGRYTLTRQDPGDRLPKDVRGDDRVGPLFASLDKCEFYQAVAQYIAKIAAPGKFIDYQDIE